MANLFNMQKSNWLIGIIGLLIIACSSFPVIAQDNTQTDTKTEYYAPLNITSTAAITGPITVNPGELYNIVVNGLTSANMCNWQLYENGVLVGSQALVFGSTVNKTFQITKTEPGNYTYEFKFRGIQGAHNWPDFVRVTITVGAQVPAPTTSWYYKVTGPNGSNSVEANPGDVAYFELDATAPNYVWGNILCLYDATKLESVSIEEDPNNWYGFWSWWTTATGNPAYYGGGDYYNYDRINNTDIFGLGSAWAQQWVTWYGNGNAGPVATVDPTYGQTLFNKQDLANYLGIPLADVEKFGAIRLYTSTYAGGQYGASPLRLGFRLLSNSVATFHTFADGSADRPIGYNWYWNHLDSYLKSDVELHPSTQKPDIEIKTDQNPPKNDANTQSDPVWTNSGEFFQEVTDLTIPGRGFPFRLTRTYRAQIEFNGPLGYGWDFNYNERLVEKTVENKVLYFNGSARRDEFLKQPDGSYTAPTGFYVFLTKLPDNTFKLQEQDGMTKIFSPNAQQYNLYTLQSITDRNNNQMTFQYKPTGRLDQITDTLGRVIKVNWGDNGRISEIEDFAGRKIKYGIDDKFDLVTVTSPSTIDYSLGKTTGYAYSTGFVDVKLNHNILTVTDPKGQTYTVNIYDDKDRVITQTYGSGMFVNEYIDATGTEVAKVKVTDRENNLIEYWLTPQGNVSKKIEYTRGIRSTDPASFITQYEHITSTEGSKTIFPKGNSLEYIFDINNSDARAKGNILQVRRKSYNSSEPDIVASYTYESLFNQIKTLTDALSQTTTFYFDYEEATLGDLNGDGIINQNKGNLVKILYPTVTKGLSAGQVIEVKFWYNDFGQAIRSIDPNGNVTVYEYYTSGPQNGYFYRTRRDINGENVSAYTVEYDNVGNVIAIYDGKGNKTTFNVNELNQIVKAISCPPFNYEIKTSYDANENVSKIEVQNKNKDGNPDADMSWITTQYSYDSLDNRTSKAEQALSSKVIITTNSYDKNGNMDLYTQPLGNQIKRTYDERNLLFETVKGYGTVDWTSTKLYYDLNGNLSKMIDGQGNETTYLVDGLNRALGYIDALGNRLEMELDAVGNVSRVIKKDASNAILSETKYFYDEINRNYETREWVNITNTWVITQKEFNRNSGVVRIIDANNHETKIYYDGLDRVIKTEDHLGNKKEYHYDANGNVETITESEKTPSGTYQTFVTQNQYNNLNRLIQTSNPISATNSYGYDSRGNCTYTVDGKGNTVNNFYDGLNRLTKTVRDIRAGGTGSGAIIDTITTEYKFDDNSRLYNLIDDTGNITGYLYDDLNRPKEEIFVDGSRRRFFYDGADNVQQIIDQNGSIIDQTFDNLNRLTRRDITRGTGVLGATFESFGYDGLYRMTSAANDYSSVGMNYDTLSNMRSETMQIGAQSVKSVVSDYDNVGNRTKITYPSGKIVNIVPDELGRIKQIKDNTNNIIAQYAYVGPSRVAQRDYINGIKLAVVYDANRRVTNYEHRKADNSLVAGFEYAYDNEDNKLFEKRTHDNNKGDAYLYDSIYRITGVKYGVPNLNPASTYNDYITYDSKVDFTLDGVGNRTQVISGSQTTVYSVNNLNQYFQVGSTPHSYDSNGNLNDDGTNLYFYDYANRLVEVKCKSDNTSIVLFTYDALGRRIEKKAWKTSGQANASQKIGTGNGKGKGTQNGHGTQNALTNVVEIAQFYYDGNRIIDERDGNDAVIAQYTFGNGIDEMLTMERNSQTYYYHENTQGNIYAVTNNVGDIIEKYDYSIYGKVTIKDASGNTYSASQISNRFMFTGREYDSETGLYYYRARYYSPELGRFLQRDMQGVDSIGSLYAYVNNDPINYIDPLGLELVRNGQWHVNGETSLRDIYNQLVAQGYTLSYETFLARVGNQNKELHRCTNVDFSQCPKSATSSGAGNANGTNSVDSKLAKIKEDARRRLKELNDLLNAWLAYQRQAIEGLNRINIRLGELKDRLEGLKAYQFWASATGLGASVVIYWIKVRTPAGWVFTGVTWGFLQAQIWALNRNIAGWERARANWQAAVNRANLKIADIKARMAELEKLIVDP